MQPYAYVCLWKYEDNKSKSRCPWELVECYGVDDDGYACTPSTQASNDRHSYENFVSQKVWYDPITKQKSLIQSGYDDDYDFDDIPGRAVTVHHIGYGTNLVRFNPPTDVKWLDAQFVKHLMESPTWYRFIEGGYTMVSIGAAAVQKLFLSQGTGT